MNELPDQPVKSLGSSKTLWMRRCHKCNQWKSMTGGYTLMQGRKWYCAGCKPLKKPRRRV